MGEGDKALEGKGREYLPEETFRRLFFTWKEKGSQDALQTILDHYEPLVKMLASYFGSRSRWKEDVLQVARIGLFKALSRFDPSRGVKFISFAVPTITGEIKRFFRDKSWPVRLPRRVREHFMPVIEELGGYDLSNLEEKELKERIERVCKKFRLRKEDVEAVLEATSLVFTSPLEPSLELDFDPTDSSSPLWLGDGTPELEREGYTSKIEEREFVHALLKRLPPREREILILRYFDDLSQTQVAKALGISQMHVSRIERRALRKLRRMIEREKYKK